MDHPWISKLDPPLMSRAYPQVHMEIYAYPGYPWKSKGAADIHEHARISKDIYREFRAGRQYDGRRLMSLSPCPMCMVFYLACAAAQVHICLLQVLV